jgi:hypothetical protein
MVTAKQLMESGRLKNKDARATGIWEIDPPIALIAMDDSRCGSIKKGQTYHASRWSESGKYRGHLHFHPELAYWWNMEFFELAILETTPAD